jgi:hypothetical protein
MNEHESGAHSLLARLRYLLMRLEGEFFHVQPDLDSNGKVTSLALCSILNEAVNLQETVFPDHFWDSLKAWGLAQTWEWNDVEIRFTWWPVCATLRPFQYSLEGTLAIGGREANNAVKHHGALATLNDAVQGCAATWFLVMERAREVEVFLGDSDGDRLFSIFDCYDLIDSRGSGYGHIICRPLPSQVSYPRVRGPSEVPLAKAAFERRYSNWKK